MRRVLPFAFAAFALLGVCGGPPRDAAAGTSAADTTAAPDTTLAPASAPADRVAPTAGAHDSTAAATPADSVAHAPMVAPSASRGDSTAIPPPAPLSYLYDAFEQGVARPAARMLDPSRWVRRASHSRPEAADVDAADRVRLPSAWWQPRVGYKPVTVDEMLTGPGPGTGPANGPWTVVAAKTEGVSKGMTVKDSTGARFVVKFDNPGCEELATSADVVASKLFWAAGYNVPDNTIAFFRREDLKIARDATHSIGGRKEPITPAFLDGLLRGIPTGPDGRYRVIASRFLKGKPLGEWRYDGRRKGDEEDRVPHELRRELRGLWAIDAWINHTDGSARNTLDMYVTDGGRSFVRHHLIDFSGCLGSASIAPQPMRSGREYWLDYATIARALVTLSLPAFPWERAQTPSLTGVGFFESATFDPSEWRPYLPNPALDERTERDIRWGARIVAGFSDEMIRAAVDQGRYSDPRASDYLVRTLAERRDKIARRWLGATPASPVAAAADPPDSDSTTTPVSAAVDTATAPTPAPEAGPAARPLGFAGRVRRGATNVLTDGWVVLESPFRLRGEGLIGLGVVLGAEALLYANDQAITDASIRNREAPVYRTVLDVGRTLEPVGFMGRTNPIYVAALGAGYAFHIPVLRTIPAEILESHLIAGGVRNLGKILVGRKHPYQDEGPYAFDFAHGSSFPSGHTSVVFELATIASMNVHQPVVTVAAYALATTVAFNRIETRNHWSSDVLIAAAYGTLVARTVVRLHRERMAERTGTMSLLPYVSDDGHATGLRVLRRF